MAPSAHSALTQPAPSAPQPAFDRSIASGYIADGPQLSVHIRGAVEAARAKRKRWASHRNLEPASLGEAPMPDLLPHAGATTYPGPPSQPRAAARLVAVCLRLGDLGE